MIRFDELCGPYAAVVDIDKAALPCPDAVDKWNGDEYAAALRHEPSCGRYNPNFRQIIHIGYKIAAEMGQTYLEVLDKYEDIIAGNVRKNILERHIKPLFLE